MPHPFRIVQLTTKAGKSVRGIRLNEDTYSIQIRDFNGNPQSFWKADVTAMTSEKKTNMPSYRSKLNETELNDLVAFLAGEKGAR
mgnify:CR=1 FL=1